MPATVVDPAVTSPSAEGGVERGLAALVADIRQQLSNAADVTESVAPRGFIQLQGTFQPTGGERTYFIEIRIDVQQLQGIFVQPEPDAPVDTPMDVVALPITIVPTEHTARSGANAESNEHAAASDDIASSADVGMISSDLGGSPFARSSPVFMMSPEWEFLDSQSGLGSNDEGPGYPSPEAA